MADLKDLLTEDESLRLRCLELCVELNGNVNYNIDCISSAENMYTYIRQGQPEKETK